VSVVLKTHADPGSDGFRTNAAAHAELIDDLRAQWDRVHAGGGPKAAERHTSRGKLLPRERVRRLLDRGSPFLELSTLAAHGMYEGQAPGAGIITGIGRVHGREVMIVCNDATVKGGSYFPMTARKHTRAQEIALQNRLPCIYLVDSGGGYLPLQDELFPDVRGFGQSFYNQANMSAEGIAQIAAVLGSCTAGGAYVPAMSDESVIVRNQGTIFLGGPPLVKAATGEEVSAEELGGGELHTRRSGVADHLARNDLEALALVRSIVETLAPRPQCPWERQVPEPPAVDPETLTGAVPADIRIPYDPREIISRILDGSRFHEFKAGYGTTLICGLGHLHGHRVGVLANHGVIFSSSALKGAHFIEMCDQRGIPLVFLQNITGFMVGREAEEGGIAKDGAKMIAAVSVARVPKLTVIVGGSFGAGNYGMSGRPYFPRFLWMWPNARISVMGGEQAATVLTMVGRETDPEAIEERKREIRAQYETQGHPYYASARLWDDGVIDPRSTRDVLGLALSVCANAPLGPRRKPVFRM
jgi:3-methylcrotonyl-CoA carboxylase beta subunit